MIDSTLIQECQSLDCLFGLWKSAQLNEDEESYKKTCPKSTKIKTNDDYKYKHPEYSTYKNNFCPDGVTSIKGQEKQNQKIEVLFILKESNTGGVADETNDFWFNISKDNTREKYANRLYLMLEKLQPECNRYTHFGYVNLNKRGGYGKTHTPSLNNYINMYHDFIIREIELLNPDYIVCCGCFDSIAKILGLQPWKKGGVQTYRFNDKNALVYYIYHPSCNKCQFNKSLNVLNDSKAVRQ